jgi:outer membrane protein assembly factor BamB
MARCPTSAVLLLLLLAAGPLPAEPPARTPLPGESAATGRRLDAADKLAAAGQLAAAADEYAHILDEAGDDLVPVGDRLSAPARRLCHLRLAALPADVLRPYRTRVDPLAKKWLDQGAADHDVRPLERIVEEAFCGSHSDAALDLLGDLAFERGHFHEAERWWRMLALPASEAARRARQPLPPPWTKPHGRPPSLELLYPDPRADVARARAKQVLALLFRGEVEAATAELEAFRTMHPAAQGHLAGRDGNYADILRAVASRPVPAVPAEDAWTTFAGDPARGAALPAEPSDPNRLNPLVSEGPALRFRLDTRERVPSRPQLPRPTRPGDKPVPFAEQVRRLAFHPVVLGRLVLVADARSVTAFDTATGEGRAWDIGKDYLGRANDLKGLKTELPAPDDLRYTLTVDDGRVYARLGVQGLHPARTNAEARSFLVCLKPAGDGPRLTPVWVRASESPDKGPPVMFEGAPVVRDGLLHVAATRFEGNQMITEVRCYSATADGPPRWKADVAATRDLPAAPRYRHQLLTLAGRHVVFASHAGAVVALDARTGHRTWAVRYPSAVLTTPGGRTVPRDLAPAAYAEGRLYVAPADYDRLLCLDPETGAVLWERERVEVVHLLGVGGGRLTFTTPRGIRAVRAADGADEGGWQTPADPGHEGLPSFGRGFLAGEYVFWPTRAGIKVLSQADGLPPFDLVDGPLGLHNVLPGNLAFASDTLAVADATHLTIYLPPGRRGAGAAGPAEGPTGPLNALSRRAGALAAAGRPAEALAAWQHVLTDHGLRGGTLRDARRLPQSAAAVAADRIDELLRTHGRELYAPTEEKARALLSSAGGDAAALERLADDYPNATAVAPALLRLAKVHEEAGRWGAAAHAYRRLLWRGTPEDERQAALTGLSRALDQERQRCPTPAAPPDLAPPLARAWDSAERLLPDEGPPGEDLLLVRGAALVCRDAATGAERWAQPVAGSPSWAGRHAAIAVVAGPGAIQGVALSDGTRLWELPAPDPATFADPHLSGFRLAAGRFFCLQGEVRLLALDVESGRVLWQQRAPAAGLGADVPGGRFSPHYLATAEWVLLQAAGRCCLLDARTGSLLRELTTEDILWAQPPLPLERDRVAVVNGRRLVAALDLPSCQVAWSYTLPRPDSLSGEPPLLLGGPDALFVVVPRNQGYALQRLDPATGQALWADEVALGPDRIDPGLVALDRDGVYYSSGAVITALSPDGRRDKLWQEALPGTACGWRLRRAGGVLLAWPAEARRAKFHSRWLAAALELTVTFPPEGRPGRGVPVLLLDPQSGRVIQRLNFAPPVPRAQGRLAFDEEPAAVPGLAIECAAADGPIVRLTREGLIVGWDSKAWALRRDN